MTMSIGSTLRLALILLFLLPETVDAAVGLTVVEYRCDDSQNTTKTNGELITCQIGDRVIVKVSNLEEWLSDATTKHRLDKLVLALNGQLLVGSHPGQTFVSSDPDETVHELSFELVRQQQNAINMAAWKTLLARTTPLEPKKMTIALAVEDSVERYGQKDIRIRVASELRVMTVIIVFFGLVATFIWLFASKGLLRDMGPKPAQGSKPFSLGAAQMAFSQDPE